MLRNVNQARAEQTSRKPAPMGKYIKGSWPGAIWIWGSYKSIFARKGSSGMCSTHRVIEMTDREGVKGKCLTSNLSLLGCVYTMSQYSFINLVVQLLWHTLTGRTKNPLLKWMLPACRKGFMSGFNCILHRGSLIDFASNERKLFGKTGNPLGWRQVPFF